MATVVISLWARLTTRVRSLAVTKGTGGCKESGAGTVGEERRGRFSALASVELRPPGEGGVADRRGPVLSVSVWLPVCLPLRPQNGLVRLGAGHRGIRPTPPTRPLPRSQGPSPDSPPSAPCSPRAPGCCLRVAAAARGAGCRRRCCRWT